MAIIKNYEEFIAINKCLKFFTNQFFLSIFIEKNVKILSSHFYKILIYKYFVKISSIIFGINC